MFCNECGTENRNDRKFCTNCGAALIDYTKPRENLIMADDVKHKQEIIAKKNKLAKKFNIALALIMLVTVALAVSAYYFTNKLRFYFGAGALVLCLVFIITWIVKVVIIKKLSKHA